jgi:hypothetical protein
MKPLHILTILLLLVSFAFLTGSKVQAKEVPVFTSLPETASFGNEYLSFCPNLQISSTGAICASSYGFTARLDFPQVNVENVLAGKEFLPNTEAVFSAKDQLIQGVQYRNIAFVLRWESTTPDFLQVYMTDILPGWEGRGIPYRLLWRARYEVCAAKSCETWTEIKDKGEYLPVDVPDLPENLAADSNFNGVPASFWNTNLTVK